MENFSFCVVIIISAFYINISSFIQYLAFCKLIQSFGATQANNYLLKVNNRNTRKRCEKCLKIIKTPERRHCRRCVFIVNFEHISQIFLIFSLLTLKIFSGIITYYMQVTSSKFREMIS